MAHVARQLLTLGERKFTLEQRMSVALDELAVAERAHAEAVAAWEDALQWNQKVHLEEDQVWWRDLKFSERYINRLERAQFPHKVKIAALRSTVVYLEREITTTGGRIDHLQRRPFGIDDAGWLVLWFVPPGGERCAFNELRSELHDQHLARQHGLFSTIAKYYPVYLAHSISSSLAVIAAWAMWARHSTTWLVLVVRLSQVASMLTKAIDQLTRWF